MMKNIFLQLTELYNMTCICVCILKNRISCLLCLKTKTPSCIPKKKLNFCICVWTSMTWLWALESPLPFKTAFRNFWETAQLTKMLCDNAPLTVQQFVHNIVSPNFLLHWLSLTCWKLLPLWRVFYFFSYDFKNREHLLV